MKKKLRIITVLLIIALLTLWLEFSLDNPAFANDESNKPKTDAVSAMLLMPAEVRFFF